MAEFGRYSLPETIAKKAFAVPAHVGSQVVSWPLVRSKLDSSYHFAKATHAERIPHLSEGDAAIVDAINRNGVFVTDLQALDLPQTATMLQEAHMLAARYEAMSRQGRVVRSFQADGDDVFSRKSVFLWGLNRRLLDLAEAYVGLPIGYDGMNIFYTKADNREHAARRWHRDCEDRRMLKVAVYLNDVDDGGGPLELLHADIDDDASAASFSDAAMRARLGGAEPNVTTCVGPAGTVIFADTARYYHRGRPATTRDRCALYFNYISRRPIRPFRCERSTLTRKQIRLLASEDLTEHQRDCLLWRDALPFLARVIPPAPVW